MRISIVSIMAISFSSYKNSIALLNFNHSVTVAHVADCNTFELVFVIDTNVHVQWSIASSLNYDFENGKSQVKVK